MRATPDSLTNSVSEGIGKLALQLQPLRLSTRLRRLGHDCPGCTVNDLRGAARRQPQVPTAPGKASFAEAAALPATESVGAGMQKSREGRTVSGPGNGGGPSSMIM